MAANPRDADQSVVTALKDISESIGFENISFMISSINVFNVGERRSGTAARTSALLSGIIYCTTDKSRIIKGIADRTR